MVNFQIESRAIDQIYSVGTSKVSHTPNDNADAAVNEMHTLMTDIESLFELLCCNYYS